MFCTVNGVRLYYEVCGQGQPMLLVHGNSESHTIFDKSLPELARNHRVYTPDSRCHGQSSCTDRISYDLMADDLIGFIRELGLERPVFYGFSDGGIVGLLVARDAPTLMSEIIVSGANLNPKGLKWPVRMEIHSVAFRKKDKLWRLMEREPHIEPASLGAISIPVHVLAGQHDMVKTAHTKRIAKSIPGATLKILPGETHGSYIVHSDKLAPILLELL